MTLTESTQIRPWLVPGWTLAFNSLVFWLVIMALSFVGIVRSEEQDVPVRSFPELGVFLISIASVFVLLPYAFRTYNVPLSKFKLSMLDDFSYQNCVKFIFVFSALSTFDIATASLFAYRFAREGVCLEFRTLAERFETDTQGNLLTSDSRSVKVGGTPIPVKSVSSALHIGSLVILIISWIEVALALVCVLLAIVNLRKVSRQRPSKADMSLHSLSSTQPDNEAEDGHRYAGPDKWQDIPL